MHLPTIRKLISNVSCSLFGTPVYVRADEDKRYKDNKGHGRVYIQCFYYAQCTKGGSLDTWKGKKHYLSEFMTDDEIIKQCYVAFEAAVKHEMMEGFKYNGTILFNPHADFRELLKISKKEVTREDTSRQIVNFDV